VSQNPALNITKSVVAVDGDTEAPFLVDEADDVISYEIVVSNEGNATLTGVSVSDPLLADLDCDPADGLQTTGLTIAVGGSLTCSGTYTITPADLAAGGNYDTDEPDDGLFDVFRNVTTADSNETGEDSDDAEVPVIAQPSLSTTPRLIPQDTIVLSNLTTGATGTLYVELQIDADCGTADPPYWRTWDSTLTGDNQFTGNGTYYTANTFEVTADATIRWCVSYSGDDHNASIPLSDHGEVVKVDFDPFITGALLGAGVPLLLWALWTRRRRQTI